MVWIDQKLGDLFPEQLAAAEEVAAEIQAKIDALTPLQTLINQKLAAAQAAAAQAQVVVNNLGATGFYAISLTPEESSWSARLANADNAPNQSPTLYSAVVATLIVAASGASVSSAYNDVKTALKTTLKVPSIPTPRPSAPELIPEQDGDWMSEDVWAGRSLKDMYPAAFAKAEVEINRTRMALSAVQNQKAAMDGTVTLLGTALSTAGATINKFNNTGIYSVALPPALGNWLSRMTDEPDAPPDATNGYFVAGTVVVIVAASEVEVQTLYDKLLGVL
ncbi:MAG TPA: hypothetical protein PLV42_06850 [bacterium]|nr:hypothetical protein [bacterium]